MRDAAPIAWIAAPARTVVAAATTIATLSLASAVWLVSLREIDLTQMTDLGLVSVFPAATMVSLLLVTLSFALCLRLASTSAPLLFLHVLALIVMLYGITIFIEEVPRFPVTWRHLGVTEYIMRTGDVDPTIDAYFNWPGFFVLSAFVTELTGLSSPRVLADWTPIFFNVLYLAPLVVIYRTVTSDLRLVWLGVWIFYATNWIGQDYFSPQGLMYFLYLVIVAIILRSFTRPQGELTGSRLRLRVFLRRRFRPIRALIRARDAPERLPRSGELRPWQRVGLMAITIVLFAAIVPSHQLTPFVVVLVLTTLIAFGLSPARGLPMVMIVLIGTWIAFLATEYLAGHLDSLTGHVGEVEGTVGANVGERLHGSADHLFIVYMRLLMTAALWTLAMLGAIRAYRRARPQLTFALLALSPFLLLLLQPYGGEILLRVYLFALPFMAFFAASLFYPESWAGRSWLTSGALGLTGVVLLGGFFFTRYGNERMDYFTAQEVGAMREVYDVASPGSLLIAGSKSLPWKFRDYEKFTYRIALPSDGSGPAGPSPRGPELLQALTEQMRGHSRDAYLIITRSQKAESEILGLAAPGALEWVERAAATSPTFTIVYSSPQAKVFTLARTGDRA
ncbi:MAG: hypothetical protein LC804_23375 [Acidobacteria bacterium]|nr:hypothetical protein [Acidobacteriota bacterium]